MNVSGDKRLTTTIGSAIAVIIFVVTGSWYTSNAFRDLKDEVKEARNETAALRKEFQASRADQWTFIDQRDFAYQLGRRNQGIDLVVPEIIRYNR